MQLHQTIPQPVYAEQFVDASTVLTIGTITSITIVDPGPNEVIRAAVHTVDQNYTMNQNDWLVVGANIEGVYPDELYQAMFVPVTGLAVAISASSLPDDPLTVQLSAFTTLSTTAHIDWGDAVTEDLPVLDTVAAIVTHTYEPGLYRIKVTNDLDSTLVQIMVLAEQELANEASAPSEMADSDMTTVVSMLGDTTRTTTDDGGTLNERIVDPISGFVQVAVNPPEYGEWTPLELARVESGLPPYDRTDEGPDEELEPVL